MSYEKMKTCADMTLANAIEDMVVYEHMSKEEARNKVLESKAYQCLYDFESGVWMEGSDYFRDLLKKWG